MFSECAKQGRCLHGVLPIAETMLLALSLTTQTVLSLIRQFVKTLNSSLASYIVDSQKIECLENKILVPKPL